MTEKIFITFAEYRRLLGNFLLQIIFNMVILNSVCFEFNTYIIQKRISQFKIYDILSHTICTHE